MNLSKNISKSDLLDLIAENKGQRVNVVSRKLGYTVSNLTDDILKDSNLNLSIPKGISKQTRELKSVAKQILGDNYLEYFKIDKLNNYKSIEEEFIFSSKEIVFNEIKSEGELYEGSLDDYQNDVLVKLRDFDWPENIKFRYDGSWGANATHFNGSIMLEGYEGPGKFISLTNHYNGLDYLGKDLPKEDTVLFLVSKLFQKRLEQNEKSVKSSIENKPCIVSRILGKDGSKLGNLELYKLIEEYSSEEMNYKIDKYFDSVNFINAISKEFQVKYPNFQLPFEAEEYGYDYESYKKGLLIKIINNLK